MQNLVICFQKRAKGSALINQVFKHVELSEKDYFGLQFMQQPGDVIVSCLLTLHGVVVNPLH